MAYITAVAPVTALTMALQVGNGPNPIRPMTVASRIDTTGTPLGLVLARIAGISFSSPRA